MVTAPQPLRSVRVRELPAEPRPNTLYFVRPVDAGARVSLYVVGSDSVPHPVLPPDGMDDPGDIAAVFNSA